MTKPAHEQTANKSGHFVGLDLDRPIIMGIVNVTPDSFSDGGEAFRVNDAVGRGRAMRAVGADILDIGGESTRPGAEPVPVAEEIRRVVPVIEALADGGALVSIDSRRAAVMTAALTAGARIVNDVTALSGDPTSLGVVADSGASVVLMHMQGVPQTMQKNPTYDVPSRDIRRYLAGRIAVCEAAGIAREKIAIDPGVGFGKNLDHNLELLAHLDVLHDLGCPIVLGASRKRFIGRLSGADDPQDRVAGSIATALAARALGVQIFRVHDVGETKQAFDVWEAIQRGAIDVLDQSERGQDRRQRNVTIRDPTP
ncbi:MAG: dihydropteroate synthase [Rhodospirillaceae bacterium]|nr:dihydropteroate synthase [Rhodospirillaceae bacterium]